MIKAPKSKIAGTKIKYCRSRQDPLKKVVKAQKSRMQEQDPTKKMVKAPKSKEQDPTKKVVKAIKAPKSNIEGAGSHQKGGKG